MILVIGSGISGISCVETLIERGVDQLMWVDGGINIKTTRGSETTTRTSNRNIPDKLVLGSDYPYRLSREYLGTEAKSNEFEIVGSLASGGLSSVWGSAIMPWAEHDLMDWPITWKDLVPYYESASKMLPLTGDDRGTLEKNWPVFTKLIPRTPSRFDSHLKLMSKNTSALNQEKIEFGTSRLALLTKEGISSCQPCSKCLDGCPKDLIYSARHTIEELVSNQPSINYKSGKIVRSIQEFSDHVKVEFSDDSGMRGEVLEFSQVFLGAGTLHSTKLICETLGLLGKNVSFSESKYFLFPAFAKSKSDRLELKNTLSQIFLEICDKRITRFPIHLQINR